LTTPWRFKPSSAGARNVIKELFVFVSDPPWPQITTPPSEAYGIW
jgi:hypothetical protein